MAYSYSKLNANNAYIWRIIHRDNLSWVLKNGIHCGNSLTLSPTWINIGNEDLINKRSHRIVPLAPGGTLDDYVPFYFTPFSPMMYNIYTGRGAVQQRNNDEIIILVSTLTRVHELGYKFLFTDRHAYPPTTIYYDNLKSLSNIDWPLLQARNFRRNINDPLQIERYQAEALIHKHLPVTALIGVICYTDAIKLSIENELQVHNIDLSVNTMTGWYF